MRTITLKYQGENKSLFGSVENYKADHCELYISGQSQYYQYGDICCSGEVFKFRDHYSERDHILFREEEDGTFTPVDWFNVPMEGDERKKYIFVFDVVEINGEPIALYDYFA